MTTENEEVNDLKTEEEEVKKNEDGNIEVPTLTKDKVEYILNEMQGMVFKVGDAFFAVKYCNVGQRRFSATLINDVKG